MTNENIFKNRAEDLRRKQTDQLAGGIGIQDGATISYNLTSTGVYRDTDLMNRTVKICEAASETEMVQSLLLMAWVSTIGELGNEGSQIAAKFEINMEMVRKAKWENLNAKQRLHVFEKFGKVSKLKFFPEFD